MGEAKPSLNTSGTVKCLSPQEAPPGLGNSDWIASVQEKYAVVEVFYMNAREEFPTVKEFVMEMSLLL